MWAAANIDLGDMWAFAECNQFTINIAEYDGNTVQDYVINTSSYAGSYARYLTIDHEPHICIRELKWKFDREQQQGISTVDVYVLNPEITRRGDASL